MIASPHRGIAAQGPARGKYTPARRRARSARGGRRSRTRLSLESEEKGSAARRRPMAAPEAYSLCVERAVEGANEADGPLSSL
jgi:hypothetical protein